MTSKSKENPNELLVDLMKVRTKMIDVAQKLGLNVEGVELILENLKLSPSKVEELLEMNTTQREFQRWVVDLTQKKQREQAILPALVEYKNKLMQARIRSIMFVIHYVLNFFNINANYDVEIQIRHCPNPVGEEEIYYYPVITNKSFKNFTETMANQMIKLLQDREFQLQAIPGKYSDKEIKLKPVDQVSKLKVLVEKYQD
jgi:DNA-binding transcriptional MerR regulator